MNGQKEWHSGIDYAPSRFRVDGDDIVSVADGVVRVVKNNPGGYGLYIVIEHHGFCSLYAHLSSFNCRVGDNIKKGDKIAEMGNTGHSTGTHLHFEIRPVQYSHFWERQILFGKSKPAYMIDPYVFIEKGVI
jgi:murein DD-endopeptidase MepM/ murein hydrolase activator NlpD